MISDGQIDLNETDDDIDLEKLEKDFLKNL